MPTNKKESILFTLTMCFFMVLGMSLYNTILSKGIDNQLLINLLTGFIPAFIVALLLDIFIVGPNAKKLAFKLPIDKTKKLQVALAISCCMVLGMVMFMSIFGLISQGNFSDNLFLDYLKTARNNVLCALPLQLLIVGPLARKLLAVYQEKQQVQA